MGIFDWFKKAFGGDVSAEGEDPPEPKKRPDQKPSKKRSKAKALETASSDDRVPGQRRRIIRDERLLPKPKPKNWWERPDPVMSQAEAQRLYSPGMRTRNRALRSLMADEELLTARRLPLLGSEHDLASLLEISVRKLWWLASHRYDDGTSHYVRFRVPKRRGGTRVIMAPKRQLKKAQRAMLREVFDHLPISDYAHGFVKGRSVKTNAEPHVGKRIVIKFDLENFFGTVTFGRVRGHLIALGYGFDVATSLALLSTEAERQPVEVDGGVKHVPIGHRYCVQGAPTSPVLCNSIAMKLDHRLAGLAKSVGYDYTRYADDMTFSGDDESKIGFFLRMVQEIVEDEGFALNDDKTRIMRSGASQKVTGVTVNEELGLSRKERRRLRAMIHRLGQEREAGNASPNELDELRGKLAYLDMLNPEQAAALRPSWLTNA